MSVSRTYRLMVCLGHPRSAGGMPRSLPAIDRRGAHSDTCRRPDVPFPFPKSGLATTSAPSLRQSALKAGRGVSPARHPAWPPPRCQAERITAPRQETSTASRLQQDGNLHRARLPQVPISNLPTDHSTRPAKGVESRRRLRHNGGSVCDHRSSPSSLTTGDDGHTSA